MLSVGLSLLSRAVQAVGGALGFYTYSINESLRFNDDDSAYLSGSTGTVTSGYTVSFWMKRGNLTGAQQDIFSTTNGADFTNAVFLTLGPDEKLYVYHNTGLDANAALSDGVLRDPSAWYHIVFSKPSGLAGTLYINGVAQAKQSLVSDNNVLTYAPQIGRRANNTSFFDGYLADVHFVDGTAYDATAFGEFKSGVWIGKTFAGTYGTNGFNLKFANSGALGTDSSGNGNTWTPTNLAATDQMLDTPTNNFATLSSVYANPYNVSVNTTLAEGNTKSTVATGSAVTIERAATIGMTSGKWYWECKVDAVAAPNPAPLVGMRSANGVSYSYGSNGTVYTNWTVPTYTGNPSFVAGDVLGVAYDADNGDLYFYKNGVVGNGGTPILTGLTGEWYPTAFNLRDTTTSGASTHNFGQDSSFAGTKTPQGNTDANGRGDFYYAPPTGYLALCTANLPEPAISPLNSVEPSQYMDTVLDTGANIKTTAEAVFGDGLYWIKDRVNTNNHQLIDYVRGTSAVLQSNTTVAETTYSAPTGNSVAWAWKAGGTPVSNTNGTITSSVSANTESGFSIVSYTGTGSAGTVGHGLNQAPQFYISKSRDATTGWLVGVDTSIYGSNVYLELHTTGVATAWSGFNPTSTVADVNSPSGQRIINYYFHSVEGFSKFGKYTGNGSADGTFVYTGFRPAFVMIKRTDSTSSWAMHDDARDPYNPNNIFSQANTIFAEYAVADVDFLSNGFKLRTTDVDHNASGGTYIFMAFSEMPFKYASSR